MISRYCAGVRAAGHRLQGPRRPLRPLGGKAAWHIGAPLTVLAVALVAGCDRNGSSSAAPPSASAGTAARGATARPMAFRAPGAPLNVNLPPPPDESAAPVPPPSGSIGRGTPAP